MPTDPTHTTAPRDLWAFARTLICDICNLFGAPQDIARQLGLTAKARAQLLTWLRAGEAVLRHLLLIEATALMPTLPPPTTTTRADSTLSCTRTRTRRLVVHDPETPEAWRVAFRAIPPHASRTTSSAPRPSTHTPANPYADYFKDPEQTAKIRAAKAAWLADMNALASSSPARGGSPERSEGKGDVGIASRAPSDRFATSSPARGGGVYSAQPLAKRVEALRRVFNAPARYARRLAFRLRDAAHLARRMLRIPADIDRAVDRETATRFHHIALARLRGRDTS